MIEVENYQSGNKELSRIITHRGDRGSIFWSIELDDESDYEFQEGDIVEFTIFEKQGYNKIPILNKKITVEEETDEVEILLTENDTLIGEPQNKPVTYWYEISLNEVNTVTGYDYEEGPLEFILLPAKAGEA